ncbi:amidohydrolase family protein [Fodinicola feengrottensis]|uniref:amidohydrolase family protein n=1 Tax=Fodinicola feengrottensis TaxID=435914 RepID=UPI0013D1E796|nr:amidohydrolase family protein [Fodinicola feengrottensis]
MGEYAADRGLPVLTHTWHTSPYDDPEVVDAVLVRHPGVRLILGHSGVSPAGMAASVPVVRRHPAAYLEVCGSSMTGPLVRWLVEQVGAPAGCCSAPTFRSSTSECRLGGWWVPG